MHNQRLLTHILGAASVVAAGVPFPLNAYSVGNELDSREGDFCERFGLGADGAVLVRPDGHVAWRREAGSVRDHVAALRDAVALAVGRSAAKALPLVA